ncbi:hypothetical protein RCH08_005378 [Janthinobacterium sp. CG_S6]|nr:hypothetical protein [Janthinobacterium sp. CG_S6]
MQLVVVKLGPDGAYFRDADGASGVVPGVRVDKVVDAVGAGDGFAAGLVSALLMGLPLERAVERGNRIGALAVQPATWKACRRAPSSPPPADLEQAGETVKNPSLYIRRCPSSCWRACAASSRSAISRASRPPTATPSSPPSAAPTAYWAPAYG